jgi:hypothetical protein
LSQLIETHNQLFIDKSRKYIMTNQIVARMVHHVIYLLAVTLSSGQKPIANAQISSITPINIGSNAGVVA